MNDSLEEKLIDSGYISSEKIEEVKELMNLNNYSQLKFEEILIEEGILEEKQLVEVLHNYLQIPKIDLKSVEIDYGLTNLFTEKFLRKNQVFPIKKEDDKLFLVMKDATDLLLIDDIENMTKLKVKAILATTSQILQLTNQFFNNNLENKKEIFEEIEGIDDIENNEKEINEIVQQAPIVKLTEMIIKEGVLNNASDIHIEPEEAKVRVRYRIDGILMTKMVLPKNTKNSLISRIKIISDMDITENRSPQDGRIEKSLGNEKIDMRVSTIPTIYGEKIVIRILKKDESLIDINKIGFSSVNLTLFKNLIKANSGIILLAGPTGSGKSTTLFAALNKLKDDSKNIITIEDPIEYKISGINQIQANSKINFSFARALKSILRQDPDIIMVGEIRDKETAQIAIRAALTGHLVLSTLHTNDSLSSITRLIDMGIPSYLVTASVIGVVAQRLLRRVCVNCKRKYLITKREKLLFNDLRDVNYLYKGAKCEQCRQTGYKGRIAVHEILIIDKEIKRLISKGDDERKIKKYLKAKGMITLYEDALMKVKKGITSVNEMMRVLDFN